MTAATNSRELRRTFFHYVSRNILGMLGLSCYILADTVFIANGVGSDGLAALNLALPVFTLINATALLLGMGGATYFAILKGQDALDKGNRVFTCACVAALSVGAVFLICGAILSGAFAGWLGADGETYAHAQTYIRFILLFAPAFLMNQTVTCFVRNDANPSLSMAAMLSISFSNILLDYLFIFPLGWGMFGAVLATCMAPLISLCVLSLHWRRPSAALRLRRCCGYFRTLLRIVRLGAASFVTELSSGVIILLFNFTILSIAGNTGVAAYGVIAKLARGAAAVYAGLGQGRQPIGSLEYGRGNWNQARRCLGWGIAFVLVLGGLFLAAGLLAPQMLVAVFNRAGDRELARLAERGIRIYFTAFVPMGVNIVACMYLAAVTRAGASFAVSILRGMAAVVPFILILPWVMGMDGVWLSVPLAETVTLLCSLIFLFAGKRESRLVSGTVSRGNGEPGNLGERL
ncbi:MAG: MATE family efflux transporter [Clostridiales bacterium]|nr:MATE family efflux transporter [Clostridiales bacterium]